MLYYIALYCIVLYVFLQQIYNVLGAGDFFYFFFCSGGGDLKCGVCLFPRLF